MSDEIVPRPVFGQPETGQAWYWEQQGWKNVYTVRRTANTAPRHNHTVCYECGAGLNDVGVFHDPIEAKPSENYDRGERLCCVCLRTLPPGKTRDATPGPRIQDFTCRIGEAREEPAA